METTANPDPPLRKNQNHDHSQHQQASRHQNYNLLFNPLGFCLGRNRVFRLFFRHAVYSARPVLHVHPIPTTRVFQQFRPERGQNHLHVFRLFVDQGRHGRPVHRVQIRVDLIKQIERRRLQPLHGEDQGERDDGLLSARELVHGERIRLFARKRNLHADTGEGTWGRDNLGEKIVNTGGVTGALYIGRGRCRIHRSIIHSWET